MDLLQNFALGLSVALDPVNLMYCLIGVFAGMFVGVIPGIGPMTAISVLFPLTFYLPPTTAMIMLAGIWYGTTYGGSVASILLNIPGTASNAVTCLDGHPMAKSGRASVALLFTAVSSFVGGTLGTLLLMFFAPFIADVALSFGSAEYFALMLLGIVAASTISEGSASKGLAAVALGILIGCVGLDIYTGAPRLTFGRLELAEGVGLIPFAMGVFGVAEVIASIGNVREARLNSSTVGFRHMKPTRDEMRRSWKPMLRGSGIGAFFGTLPGTGPIVAAFMAYAIEKRVSKTPERFGKGAVEGLAAPEASNNSADMTAFIPTLALGIPGSPTMALMLGALIIHGITPGPSLMTDEPEVVWALVLSFWVGNLILLVMNIPLIGLWVRMLTIPYRWLFPTILAFICLGTYAVNTSSFDVWLVLVFGLIGYGMRQLGFPIAPMLLGFVLGPMMEEQFRRAMLLSRGDLMVFAERPISATVLAITAAILAWSVWSALKRSRSLADEKPE